jgi:uncharacterized protein YqhQ
LRIPLAASLAALSAAEPPPAYGGQAVVEGVLMKGKSFAALALRRKGGAIEVIDRPLKSLVSDRVMQMPFLRGIFVLVDMLGLGMWALNLSVERYSQDYSGETERAKKTRWESFYQVTTLVISVALFLLIFKIGPTTFIGRLWPGATGGLPLLARDAVEGTFRLVLFIAYVFIIGLFKDIRRVFEYHGAEHASINALESDLAKMNPVDVSKTTTLHPRCGTSFLTYFIVLSIFVYFFIDLAVVALFFPGMSVPPFWVRAIERVLGIPILISVSYEIIKNTFRFRANKVGLALSNFGMLFQYLTTKPPSVEQAEVAIAALSRCREVCEGVQPVASPAHGAVVQGEA